MRYILLLCIVLSSFLLKSSSAQTLISYNNTNDDRCSKELCQWTDPTIWNGGVVPYGNVSVIINTTIVYIFAESPVSISNVTLDGGANLYVNSTEFNITNRIIVYHSSTFTIDNSTVYASMILSYYGLPDVTVQGASKVMVDTITVQNIDILQSTIIVNDLTVMNGCALTNSSVTVDDQLLVSSLELLGQNSLTFPTNGSNSIYTLTQNDAQTTTSYLNLTVFGQDPIVSIGSSIYVFASPYARILFNIMPQASVWLSGNVTLLPYPADSAIASVSGGGILYIAANTLNSALPTIISSSVPFASDFSLVMGGGNLIAPMISSPTTVSALWGIPAIIYGNVDTDDVDPSSDLTIVGNVVTTNLTVYAIGNPDMVRSPSFLVNGTLNVTGTITVIEQGSIKLDCNPVYDSPIIGFNSSSNLPANLTANLTNFVFIPYHNNSVTYNQSNFVFSLVNKQGGLYLHYTSSISDCKPAPSDKPFPTWAIIVIVVGGAAVIALIVVVVYSRRRKGYEPVMNNKY